MTPKVPDDLPELPNEQQAIDEAVQARDEFLKRIQRAPEGLSKKDAFAARKWANETSDLFTLEGGVAFGRMTFDTGETYLLGINTISDSEQSTIVISWRAAAAEAWYKSTPRDPMGLELRRVLEAPANEVVLYEDRFDYRIAMPEDEKSQPVNSAPDAQVASENLELVKGDSGAGEVETIKDEWVWSPSRNIEGGATRGEALPSPTPGQANSPSDVLLRELNRHRTGSMKQIIATIEAEQFEVLSNPTDCVLVIQGAPGTGKTVVGLHRAARILYDETGESFSAVNVNEEAMLVVGPNDSFIDYIHDVLPQLGETQVRHLSITAIGEAFSQPIKDSSLARRVKGEARMHNFLRRGLFARVEIPDTGITFADLNGDVHLSCDELTELFKGVSALPFNQARLSFTSGLQRRFGALVSDGVVAIEREVKKIWPKLTPKEFLRDFLGRAEQLLAAADDEFTANELAALYRKPLAKASQSRWSLEDRPLLDCVASLMDHVRGTYRHIVIDEAQDLSPMQLQMVGRRSLTGEFTVLGDIAQSTGPWSRSSWDDVVENLQSPLEVVFRNLEYGYRVPKEIMDFALELLPAIAPEVNPPISVRYEHVLPNLVELSYSRQSLTEVDRAEVVDEVLLEALAMTEGDFAVGIIAPDEYHAALALGLDALGVKWGGPNHPFGLHTPISILLPIQSKGLEFDAVLVVDPLSIAERDVDGWRLLYVSLTRATRRLSVFHFNDGELPKVQQRIVEEAHLEGSSLHHAAPGAENTPLARKIAKLLDAVGNEREASVMGVIDGLLSLLEPPSASIAES